MNVFLVLKGVRGCLKIGKTQRFSKQIAKI